MKILENDRELLLTQSESKTLKEWFTFFEEKYTSKQIYGFCYHRKLKIKKISKEELTVVQSQNARKYKINQDYFKTWSRNMAYVLGFWYADGCIYKGKMFDITQHVKDKYILKRIAAELEYEGPIYDYVDRQACRINFSCVVIYNDIVALGGSERKSFNLTFPEVPEELLPDFIRGFFDGDGCAMRIKEGRINTAFTCADEKFLNIVWDILKTKAGVQGGSHDKNSYSLKFGKRDSLLIGKYIYQNNPDLFLKRKRDKFIELNFKEE